MIDSEEYRLGLLSPSIIIPEYLNSISIYLFNWRIYYSRCVTHQTTLNPDEIWSSAASMGDANASSGTRLPHKTPVGETQLGKSHTCFQSVPFGGEL